MDYLQVSNLPIFWVLAGITVVVSALQAFLYVRQANKATKECGLDASLPKQAFRIGFISAIGPALGVFIVMVGLMAAIGGPMAWLRLSIIGAAATELTAANLGAQACGVSQLGDIAQQAEPLKVLAVCWFTMALNGAGWLVFTGLFTPSLDKIRNKLGGGDMAWLGVMSAACSMGIFGYLNANSIVGKMPDIINMKNTASVLTGAIVMMLLGKFVVPKVPKLAEYSLGIAMIIGIIVPLLMK